jgi:AraC-like DNA-binding protein
MSEFKTARAMAPAADLATAVTHLLGNARVALRDDPKSTRLYLVRAITLLDSQAGPTEFNPKNRPSGLAAWQVRRINDYIDQHIGAAIRTSELARVVDLSVSHFSRAFKQSFHDTASGYIARRRLDLARKLMLTTSTSLSQIALDCGLCDQSHLTRLFRRYLGTSPRNWRRQHAVGPFDARTDTGPARTAFRPVEHRGSNAHV